MKTIFTLPILLILVGFSACRNSSKPTTDIVVEPETLTKEQTAFINTWAAQFNTKQAPILSLFRNRHINRTDISQLETYLQKADTTADFIDAIESLKIKTELAIDTALTQHIKWVNDEDVSICNKVDPTFWDCFNRRYDIEGFYYLSEPLLSADGTWCLMSVNYLSKHKEQSSGGGRLYHLNNKKWEEVAYLSYWGKKPE